MYSKRLHKVSHQTEFKSDLFDKVYYADIDDIVGYMRRAYLGITTTSGDELRFYNVTVMSKTESYNQELRTALNDDLSSISSISIPDTVTAINSGGGLDFALYVKNITIPASVEVFGEGTSSNNVFNDRKGVSKLESIEFLGPDTKLDSSCLACCTNLTSVTLPGNLTEIPNNCFLSNIKLSSIEIPSTVQKIGDKVFQNCTILTAITIPDSVTSIGYSAFQNCPSLSSITIPDSVTSIGHNAFNSCDGLTSITIPDSVTSIGNGTFRFCDSLTSITIPDSVTSIGNVVFEGCNSLSFIYYRGTASGAPWGAPHATVISNP